MEVENISRRSRKRMEEKTLKRSYYRTSTASQRQRMFEVWEQTGSVKKACEAGRLGRSTFYKWKSRFEKEGYKGLEETKSHAPQNPRRTKEELVKQVIEMKAAHPEWGYQRIADELMKANNWAPVICAMTVGRILKSHGMTCSQSGTAKVKKK